MGMTHTFHMIHHRACSHTVARSLHSLSHAMLRSCTVSLTVTMLLVQGCNQPGEPGEPDAPDPIDEIEPFIAETEPLALHELLRVQEAAWVSDPLSMIRYAMLPITAPLLDFQDSDVPGCPRLIDASDDAAGIVDWRIEGDCEWEDASGKHRVEGSIVARGDINGTELEYRGFRLETEGAQACGTGPEIDTMALTGVVRVPFALGPPVDGQSQPPLPEDTGAGQYDIRILFEVAGTLAGSCGIEKAELAYDVTIDRKIERLDAAAGETDVSDVEGRVAVRRAVRESADERWQPDWSGTWHVSAGGYGSAPGDEACTRYMTGTLRLESGGDAALLNPGAPASCFGDEQTECTAWSLNGDEQSELCGFAGRSKGYGCSAGPDAPPPWAAMIILVAGLIWPHRRRRHA